MLSIFDYRHPSAGNGGRPPGVFVRKRTERLSYLMLSRMLVPLSHSPLGPVSSAGPKFRIEG